MAMTAESVRRVLEGEDLPEPRPGVRKLYRQWVREEGSIAKAARKAAKEMPFGGRKFWLAAITEAVNSEKD